MENNSTVTPSKNTAKTWALKRNFRQSITRSPWNADSLKGITHEIPIASRFNI
jgi:hypothetical protein